MTGSPPLGLMLARLERLSPLDQVDREAILALPHTLQIVGAGKFIVWEGDRVESACLLREGVVCRHKIVEGGRQIVAVHVKGDFVNLQTSLLKTADHNVEALTSADIALIPSKAILALAIARPAIAMAMWLDTLIDGAIFREWIANIGRRDARARVAHALCEFALRQEKAGLGTRDKYELPLSQEQLGDALGLTPVHINRMLMALEKGGLISRERRSVMIADWEALQGVGDFDASYLYLEPAG
jgi:CRP-like cAMP-binding protein